LPVGTGGADEQTLLARAYLSRVAEPACVPVWDFVRRAGPVEAAAAIAAGTAPAAVDAATAARRTSSDPYADLEAADRHGLRLVVPESADWPHFAFGALERTGSARVAGYEAGHRRPNESGEPLPPLALWVRGTGELASLGVRAAGIVGSRAATAYGMHVTSELAFGLASRDVVVVSGGAYGIDASAHRGALAAGGHSVIVAAGGLDRAYPAGNVALFEEVAQRGLVISESPPGCAPHRHRFLTRNRLIAAFSTGVVVVEAALRSGALNTAKHCATLQRPLMAVPGPVDSPMSAGCHALLRREENPALLVTGTEDVLAVVGSIGEGLGSRGTGEPIGRSARLDRLDPTARRVFDGLLTRRFCGPDEIATRSGVRVVEVLQALPELELAGLIESADGQYRVAA
jgi:DNA processing protein